MEYPIIEKKIESKKFNIIDTLEISINTINHALIGITTFYITWYSFSAVGFEAYQSYHAWYTTIGYQLFMSEGIMAMYSKNTYTSNVESRVWKKRIHWAMSAIGCGFAVYGMFMIIYNREITGRMHFHNTHGITGLISGVLLVFAILSGCSALYSVELRRILKPFFSKAMHNFLACACYVSGMIAIISAYVTRSWLKKADPGEIRYIMIGCLCCITCFTMIGPLKTAYKLSTSK